MAGTDPSAATYLPLIFPGNEDPACEVWVGRGVLDLKSDACAGAISDWLRGRKLFVVSSPQVLGLHGHRLSMVCRAAASVVYLTVPDGEKAKSLAHADQLWQSMLEAGGKRDSRLVTFGGGSVGDLGGFVAACFLRGIEYAQIPSTLLAQVDASIGGKTGVDTPQGKNFVGAFHQPRFVLTDTSLLETLPLGELRAGLVEAVKKASLLDADLFAQMEQQLDALLAGEAEALAPVVAGAVGLKLDVVARDVREGGLRKVLNFGHTLGHAIEQQLGFHGLRHGEAVAYGMLFALRLGIRRGILEDDLAERLRSMLHRFDFPRLPSEEMTLEGLEAAMAKDKKAGRGGLTWVLPTAVQGYRLDSEVPADWVRAELVDFLADPWA